MSCPGLHCPGCSGGQSLAMLAAAAGGLVLAYAAVPWVAERIWWIGGTAALCLVLSGAAAVWLERISDRRGVAWGAARGICSRADAILPPPPRRPAIPQVVNFNFYGADAARAAAVIRQALPEGGDGDAESR